MTSTAISCNLCASEASFANLFSISSKTFKHSSKLLTFAFALVFAMILAASDGLATSCNFRVSEAETNLQCATDSDGKICITTTSSGNTVTANQVTSGSGFCGCKVSTDCVDSSSSCMSTNGTYKCSSLSQTAIQMLGQTNTDNVSNNKLVKVLCNAYAMIIGTGGKTLAAFAIISAGIGFFTGKVSWGLLIGIAAGIGAMFGAPSIVAAISGDAVEIKCSTLVK